MKIRNTLIALGLAMVASSAFAATPQPAAAGAKKAAKHCVQRSKIGKCEKWSTDAKRDAAKAEKK